MIKAAEISEDTWLLLPELLSDAMQKIASNKAVSDDALEYLGQSALLVVAINLLFDSDAFAEIDIAIAKIQEYTRAFQLAQKESEICENLMN